MENNIQINVNLIKESARSINESKVQIDNAINRISNLSNSVEKYWEGSSTDYVERLKSCTSDMTIMIQNIEGLVELLNNMTSIIENNFNNIQSSSIDLYE